MEKYFFKMKPEELIRKIIELYREARKPRFYHPSIIRGVNRVISGLTEDLFSYFLAVNITSDFIYLSDQNITFPHLKKGLRPDTTIVQLNTVKDIFDVKKARPILIISPNEMNYNIGTVIIAPLTTKSRNYPTRIGSE